MKLPNRLTSNILAASLVILGAGLAGCGDDGDGGSGPTGPSAPMDPTHVLMSVKLSSIRTIDPEDCDAGANPGDFRTTLVVSRWDEVGNQITIGSVTEEMTVGDGSTVGAVSDPIEFVMPIEEDARFQVEYTLGEYDGDTADFENHGYALHVYDRREDQEWAPGTAYETYQEGADDAYGIHKFTVWTIRDGCQGLAKYIVRWYPVDPDTL